MLNTVLVADLIQKADFSGIRDAMEKSLAPGSQSFEQDLARLIQEGTVSRKEGLAYADSPNNLMWRLQNEVKPASGKGAEVQTEEDKADEPTFTEFSLDVKF